MISVSPTKNKTQGPLMGRYRYRYRYYDLKQRLLDLHLVGHVFFPSDSDFDEVSNVWNQIRRLEAPPKAVVQVRTEDDVRKIVGLVSELRIPFSIKSGGHNKAGYSNSPNGIIISVEKLHRRVNILETYANYALVSIGPTTHGPDILTVSLNDGYGSVSGICSTVAMSGFALNGGFGLLSRKHGLGADNIESAHIVLANGRLVVANATHHTDLFWALKGAGGGSFGVVTQMAYKLHPAQETNLFGVIWIEKNHLAVFLEQLGLLDARKELRRELSMIIEFWSLSQNTDNPHFGSMQDIVDLSHGIDLSHGMENPVGIGVWWFGDMMNGKNYIRETIATIVPGSRFMVESFPWTKNGVNSRDLPMGSEPMYYQSFTGFVKYEMATAGNLDHIITTLQGWSRQWGDLVAPDLELWGGKITDINANATSFVHRDAIFNVGVILSVPTALPNATAVFEDLVSNISKEWVDKMAAFVDGAYSNYQMASLSLSNYPNMYWGDNLPRLQEIKRKYDPTDLFSFPQSIPLPR
jgi:FAD/FMN-containing dehydrogenase